MRFSPTFLSELNSRTDLATLIGKFVDLKKTSGDTHTALCPFHSENSGSFTVSQRKGFYHCFGCNAHGNGIRFLMEHQGLSFPDAVKELANFVGMDLPQQDKPEKSQEQKLEAKRYMQANAVLEHAQSLYSKCLQSNEVAQAYLTDRGVTQDSIVKFSLGYAPDEWNTITGKNSQFSSEAIEAAGLSNKKENSTHLYDRFRDRIMFPIYGGKDRLIGFGARAIHEQIPKYLNSPETVLFKKGNNLYGLTQASSAIYQAKRLFVVEGYMDVVITSQHGVENVVASLGTSVTDVQMQKMFSLCPHVTFCMDGDAPGQNAAWRAAENILPLLDDNHTVDFMFMPDEMDPDDYIRTHGKDEFDNLARQARTLTDFVLDTFMRSTNLKNGESLAKYLSHANAMADKIKSGLIKLTFQKRIAELAGISLDTMLQMLKERKENLTAAGKLLAEQIEPSSPVPAQAEPVLVAALSGATENQIAQNISVSAKMLGICILKNKSIAAGLEPAYISLFLGATDKEMLLPLLAYIKANPLATNASVEATMAFNPHAKLINALAHSASLLGELFDAAAEAESIVVGFRKMERIWQIVRVSKTEASASKS